MGSILAANPGSFGLLKLSALGHWRSCLVVGVGVRSQESEAAIRRGARGQAELELELESEAGVRSKQG